MNVIRRGHQHGINALLAFDKLAVVTVELRLVVLPDGFCGVIQINITKRGDVDETTAEHLRNVTSALSTHANATKIQHFTRRRKTLPADDVTGHDLKTKGGCS